MIERPYWSEIIDAAWRQATIVWLSGVRRVGKTTLARSLPDALYINCDLPSAVERLRDPESFLASVREPIVVLDEVHQLPEPSRLLKIAADEFPRLRVLATGSSTLAATRKFRDSLTGRKREVHLTPVLAEEGAAFGVIDLRQRLLRGGLPQALLAERVDAELYREWTASFFARDVQELFRVDKRAGFLLLLEILLRQSGGLFEITSLGKAAALSRPTVMSYLEILTITHAVRVLRPFHGGGRRELLAQPKVYGFDTGFVAQARGWDRLRPDDCGILAEHLALDILATLRAGAPIHFWRDKQQREIAFVLPNGRGSCDTVECKWSSGGFDPRSLSAFRDIYPRGRDFVVAGDVPQPYDRRLAGRTLRFVGFADLRRALTASA
jgi:predicted AAA+ superfamily ATPase